MEPVFLQTPRLELVPKTRLGLEAELQQLTEDERRMMSRAWFTMLESSEPCDPWIHGFRMVDRATSLPVGHCAFKGPPGADGCVEIAYAVEPIFQGKGFATEAAQAMVAFAFDHPEVQRVVAHTLPESNASTRVLSKVEFRFLGDAIDIEDGPVWRWERRR